MRFGLPLSCPKCRSRGTYYGVLKVPGEKASPSCPECSTSLVSSRQGQTLVEFALVMPIFLALLLGFAELAMLFATRQGYQNGVDVLADWTAIAMTGPGESWQSGWNEVVRQEADRTGCDDLSPAVLLPDGTHQAGDRVLLRWICHYEPKVAPGWGGLTVTVQSEAVVPVVPPAGTSSPSPSPS